MSGPNATGPQVWRADPADAPPLVVLLGASGFIGSVLAAELSRRPVRLRLVSRGPLRPPTAPTARVQTRTADLTDPRELAEAVAGADAVVHLVAHSAGAMTWRVAEGDRFGERVNVGVVRDLVSVLARQTPRRPPVLLFAGSTSQAGLPDTDRIDGTEPDQPVNAYDRQKLAAENLVKDATAAGVVRGASLRLATVFGHCAGSGADDRGVVAMMTRRALAGEPLTMWHDGSVKRDLVYVSDVAAAFMAALDHADALAGGHWLIGTGQPTSVADLFTTIARTVAAHTGRPPVPVVSVPPPAAATSTDFHSFTIDSTAFARATGWRPVVPLVEALRRTVRILAPAVGAGAFEAAPDSRRHLSSLDTERKPRS